MSDDRRERILSRLLEIMELDAVQYRVDGASFFTWRNRDGLDEKELPAYVLLDGRESKVVGASDARGRRGPQLMAIEAQLYYVPLPSLNQLNEDIGPRSSAHRGTLLKRVMEDSSLADLAGENGYVDYRLMETDMQADAGTMVGQFRLDIYIVYTLKFTSL